MKRKKRTAAVSAVKLISLSRQHRAALEQLYDLSMRLQLENLQAVLNASPRVAHKAKEALAWALAMCPTCKGSGWSPHSGAETLTRLLK